ncbi:MAG: SusD/RagB family nutrient-binding outer membrane lipoprotein [Bacteroidales bacterium]|nr:SusD/RagB family nutrient-binding outer membrane lipoprotein [Bacteroidales bacterium]MBN2698341.1 SusD/RagB family nutrient-binding outer membrane lipoprotein [Bacteroidales bacterium]
MKKFISNISLLLILLTVFSCSDDIMDEIDTDPNNPTDVPIQMLMPGVTVGTPYWVTGTTLAWFSSVFVEQTAGAHGQMRDADRRANINSQLSENSWAFYIYPSLLPDLKIIIEKGSEGGTEEGKWAHVGIAKILMAYTMLVSTDTWGRIPYTEALLGNENRKPAYDTQESIYNAMFDMLDEAIDDLQKESFAYPGTEDLIFEGDLDRWIKTAYSLKARYCNRLSKRDATGSAADALAAAANGFESLEDDFSFVNWADDPGHENTWYQEENERKHHAISATFYDILESMNDPRIPLFCTMINDQYVPAPNGTALQDQAGQVYSRISNQVIYATAPLPIMTYAELKFIEAECHLRKASPDPDAALAAYEDGLNAALEQAGVSQGDINTFKNQEQVLPPDAADLTLEMIYAQKYIALWPYGSVEAYAEWRRTGYPEMNNPFETPRRFPYPQNEISGNGENVPDVTPYNGVWWDDGTED